MTDLITTTRRVYTEIAAGRVPAVLPLIHPELVIEEDPPFAGSGPLHGSAGLVALLGFYRQAFDAACVEVGRVVEVDGGALVCLHVGAGGNGYDQDHDPGALFHLTAFREGRLASVRAFRDCCRVLEAASPARAR